MSKTPIRRLFVAMQVAKVLRRTAFIEAALPRPRGGKIITCPADGKRHGGWLLFHLVAAVLASGSQAETRGASPLYPVFLSGKWGYMDKGGNLIVQPQFTTVERFDEGLAPVNVGTRNFCCQKWGYIDETGRMVIPPQFGLVDGFREGLALVSCDPRHWGYIDKTGKVVIPLLFAGASFFREGLAVAGGRQDKVPIPCEPRSGTTFTVSPSPERGNVSKYGYIDKTGRWVIQPRFDRAYPFSEGLAAVTVGGDGGVGVISSTGKGGYIDKTGQLVIQPQFDFTDAFYEGLAAVVIGEKQGYIDKTGQWVIRPQFEVEFGFLSAQFSEGLAAVKIGGKWGYIDKTGQWVIQPRFEAAVPFSEGLAGVKIGAKWGYIDKTGELVIQPQFDSTGAVCLCLFIQAKIGFYEGLAAVEIDGKWGYIDKSGKYVWAPTK